METVLNPSDLQQSGPSVLHEHFAGLVMALEWVSAAIELASIVITLIGSARFIAGFVGAEFRRDGAERVRRIDRERVELGRYILAGLEPFHRLRHHPHRAQLRAERSAFPRASGSHPLGDQLFSRPRDEPDPGGAREMTLPERDA